MVHSNVIKTPCNRGFGPPTPLIMGKGCDIYFRQ